MYGIFAVTCPTLITQSQILTAFHTHLEKNKRVYRWFVRGFFSPSFSPSPTLPNAKDFYLSNGFSCDSPSLTHADDNLSIRGKSIYKLNKMT